MHVDSRELENQAAIEGDLCIVGAGTAGISIALDWMENGKKVVLLESGGFEYEPEIQSLNSGSSSGQRYYPLVATRLRYFGGTTGHWAGMCAPLDDIDFEKRSWVPNSGWPFTKLELEPFYKKAQNTLELGPYNYNFDFWKTKINKPKALPLDPTIVWNKMWQFTQTRFGEKYKDPIVRSRNIHLYTHANVVDILLNESGSKVTHVMVKNLKGQTHEVRAKHFILACGTIQNTRLLLSSNSQMAAGIGNGHDLVGRFFMEHLEVSSGELWLFKELKSDLYDLKFGISKARAELALSSKVQSQENILNGTISLSPLSFMRELKSPMDTWQHDDPRKSAENTYKPMAKARSRSMKQKGIIERAYDLHTRIEQAPNPSSRVTLSTEKDVLGVAKVHLNWALTNLDKHSVRKLHHVIGTEIGKSGVGRIKIHEFLRDESDETFPDDTAGGWHHMGTLRMHDSPRNGVVDRNCKVHELSNLHVAGAACFPTSGAANPTLTLTALALRLSHHLKSIT